MIYYQIENNLYVALMAKVNKLFECLFLAETPVDLIVILGIILMIRRRGENGREPNALHTEIVTACNIAVIKVVDSVDDTLKVTNTVTVTVGERAYEYLIEGSVIIVCGIGNGNVRSVATVFSALTVPVHAKWMRVTSIAMAAFSALATLSQHRYNKNRPERRSPWD